MSRTHRNPHTRALAVERRAARRWKLQGVRLLLRAIFKRDPLHIAPDDARRALYGKASW